MIQYIADRDHYSEVLARCERVKHDLWIGTADLKDLYVGSGSNAVPFLSVIAKLLQRGVEVRLLHAKEPGENFRADFDKHPDLWRPSSTQKVGEHQTRLERKLCPRVHFKIIIFDCTVAYIGSANLTGAGIGMKADDKRNFEAGILTDEPELVDAAAAHIDSVWQGLHCTACKRKDFCGDQIK